MQCLLTVILLAFCWRPRLRRLLVGNLLVPWWLRPGQLKPKRMVWQWRRKTKVQFDVAGCKAQGALPSRKKPAWVLAEVLRLAVHLQTPRAIAKQFQPPVWSADDGGQDLGACALPRERRSHRCDAPRHEG